MNAEVKSKFDFWTTDSCFDELTKRELLGLEKSGNFSEIEDRFYRELAFGTGGLRGIMGAGTNRMNRYTVGKATLGFGQYLLQKFSGEDCKNRGVVIAYDTRNYSFEFAKIAAHVLSALAIRVNLLSRPSPTPQLSFSIRYLNCISGIVITASHNPKEYNGYKVYDETGDQLVPSLAKDVIQYVNAITDYPSIPFQGNESLIFERDTTQQFVEAVLQQRLFLDSDAKSRLRVVYKPLHRTGNLPVRMTLNKDGFSNVLVVPEQELPDGDFPTVKSPNPEDRSALLFGLALAQKQQAHLVLGTDPDSDRVGVGVRKLDGTYVLLTGNQIGALLLDFILNNKDLSSVKNPAVVKTIVTSEFGALIAKKHGLKVFSTLTGFKFVGEKINQFEKAWKDGNTKQQYSFVFGYEDSFGYLTGTHARDKDAVVSVLLICEMAAQYLFQGKTIFDRLQELYCEFGFFLDALDSVRLTGQEGVQRMNDSMSNLRKSASLFPACEKVMDYSTPVPAEDGFGFLPESNVLKLFLNDGSWLAVRPSGTEPKIKIYYNIKARDEVTAKEKLSLLRSEIQDALCLSNLNT